MNFFSRLSNGWTIAMNSFNVLQQNKQLLLFPILSGVSMLLVCASFFTTALAQAGWQIDYMTDDNYSQTARYVMLFVFYFINYFVIVFFNVALMHCVQSYFKGEEVSIKSGLRFSTTRIVAILSWALLAATVGTLLRILQDGLGKIGQFVIGLIGIAWNIATFFVIPVIAYENEKAIGAFQRSTQIMKEKWGEKVGATFSFALVQMAAFVIWGALVFLIGSYVNAMAALILAALGTAFILAVMGAAQSIFLSAVYLNVTGNPVDQFHQNLIDELFVAK